MEKFDKTEKPETEKVESSVEKQRNEVRAQALKDEGSSLTPKEYPEDCICEDGKVVRRPEYLDDNKEIKWEEYAPNGGFEGELTTVTLKEGDIVQRYGDEKGSYVAPEGTRYEQLSMPYEESQLEKRTYRVTKDIDNVEMGKVAPAFDQEGGGTQYRLPDSIEKLEKDKYLEEI